MKLDLFALAPQVGKHGRDTALGNRFDSASGDEQRDPSLFLGNPKSLVVEIGLESPTGLAM